MPTIPIEFLMNRDLGHIAIRVYLVLETRYHGIVRFPSIRELASAACASIPGAKAAVEQLRQAGAIRLDPSGTFRFHKAQSQPRPISKRRVKAFKETDGRCFYCGEPAHCVDHVVAVGRRNLTSRVMDIQRYGDRRVAACGRCNASKSDHSVDLFRSIHGAPDKKFWAERELGLVL